MDLKDALQLIQQTAVEAKGFDIIRNDGVRRRTLVHSRQTGLISDIPHDTTPRAQVALAIETILALAVESGNAGEHPVIWHDHDSVVLDYVPEYGDEYATFALREHPHFTTLKNLTESPRQYTQAEFLHLLKYKFFGIIDPTFVAALTKVKFTKQTENGGEINRGKESIGRSVQAQVTGVEGLPEEVTLRLRVYENLGLGEGFPVHCQITVHMESEKFSISAFPCELQAAIDASQATLHEMIVAGFDGSTDVKVRYGSR